MKGFVHTGGITLNSFVRSFGDWLHDNRVAGYQVDLRARTLTMDTVTEAGAPVTVRFTGLLAHQFENVEQENILLDLEEITAAGFLEKNRELLDRALPYGFPVLASREELGRLMEERGIRAFEIYASLGLTGFVLAEDVEVLP